MARILAIDYGKKRTGLAITDPLQIIATGLKTCPTHEVLTFLREYLQKETVEALVVGYPKKMNNTPSEAVAVINPFVKKLRKIFPAIPVYLEDERLTSKMAEQTLIDAGARKKDRRKKELVDTISATLILQSYLQKKRLQQ